MKKSKFFGYFVLFAQAFAIPQSLNHDEIDSSTSHKEYPHREPDRRCKEKKNMIFMISDDFGPASETVARQYYQSGSSPEMKMDMYEGFRLDAKLVGTVRTHSASHWVTDSASSATAYACSIKTYNTAIAVDNDARPCATVLEAVKEMGYLTGFVATSRVTHATPASFSSHVPHRDDENAIALQQLGEYELGRQVDLLMGGGKRHFIPKSEGGKREDGRDLLSEAQKFGWKTIIEDVNQLQDLDAESLPIMAFFAKSHMAYDIDRTEEEPSLKEMAQKAIEVLDEATRDDCDSPGFFIMIEGSRIDHAAHDNDISAHFHEVLAYHDAVNFVIDWVDAHPNALAISVADHETGGLTIGNSPLLEDGYKPSEIVPYPYQWFPGNITRASHSAEWMEITFGEAVQSGIADPAAEVKRLIAEHYGIRNPKEDEIQTIVDGIELDKSKGIEWPAFVRWGFAGLLSSRCEVGWSTTGHSGVDVNLYAWGQVVPSLKGNIDNTHVGKAILQYLNIHDDQIARITARLAAT